MLIEFVERLPSPNTRRYEHRSSCDRSLVRDPRPLEPDAEETGRDDWVVAE